MKNLLLILSIIVSNAGLAQNLSARSNAIFLDFKSNNSSESLPVIDWQYPKTEHTNSKENRITTSAFVQSEFEINKVELVLLNGKTGKRISKKQLVVAPGSKTYALDQSLWLPDGPVFIELHVTNKDSVTVTSRRMVTVGDNVYENLLSIDRKDYALIFATDRYDYWDDLVNPIDDAHAIAESLKKLYGFEVEIVENASLEEVWEKLRAYSEKRYGTQDQLMIFFAGHGHYDESFGEGYVVASNSLSNDKARTSYISHNRLRGVVDNIPCEHILLTMDVCFGGTLDPRIAQNRGPNSYEVSVSDMLVRKLQKKTRKYLTSGGKEYVSDGIPGKHSPFASKLLEAYKSEGGDDRVLTMSEIQAKMENLAQVPRFGAFGADEALSDFVFIAK